MFIVDHALLRTKRHKLFFITMACLLSLCAAIYYLTCTPSGFKFTLKVINPILSNQGIEYNSSKITGNIFAFYLHDLSVKTDSTLIDISDINLTYNPFKILIGDIQINSARIGSVMVSVMPDASSDNETNSEKDDGSTIFPLSLYANNVNVENIKIMVNDKLVVTATNLKADISIIKDSLSFTHVSGKIYDQIISLHNTNGLLSFHPPFVINVETDWKLKNGNILNSELHSHLNGPLIKTFVINTKGFITTSKQVGELNINVETSINENQFINKIKSLDFNSNHMTGEIGLNYSTARELVYTANVKGIYYTQSIVDTIPYAINLTARETSNSSKKISTMELSSCLFSINNTDTSCQAELEYSTQKTTLKTLVLTNTERNDNLTLYGDILPSPNLNWQANLEQISYYLPQMDANIQSEGSLSSSWEQPLLTTHTTIKGLEYQSKVLPSIILDVSHTKKKQD
ncbi:MAG: hypothetical protein ACJA0H_002171, partial [Francisellaceae bacterium]